MGMLFFIKKRVVIPYAPLLNNLIMELEWILRLIDVILSRKFGLFIWCSLFQNEIMYNPCFSTSTFRSSLISSIPIPIIPPLLPSAASTLPGPPSSSRFLP